MEVRSLAKGGSPAGSIGEVQFNSSVAFGADSNLFWDNANKWLGIGGAPDKPLDVAGDVQVGSILNVGGGTGSAGAIHFFSSTVKIARSGASGLDFYCDGGLAHLSILSEGNLGLSNANPTAKLHVVGETDTEQLILKANATQTDDIFQVQDSTGNADIFTIDSNENTIIYNEANIQGDLNHDGANVGFYSTAPVTLQTGVAVSAAGVHAALVNLGLITA